MNRYTFSSKEYHLNILAWSSIHFFNLNQYIYHSRKNHMINFFRKSREKMANKNHPIKYLRYAIGEIILVVLGILIALQINTWTKEKENRKKEVFYLQGLKEDLKQDILALDKSIKFEAMISNTTKRILKTFQEDDRFLMKDEIIEDLNVLMASTIPNTHTTIFEELNATGQIGLIAADSLRNQIIQYYQKQQSSQDSFETNISGVFQPIVHPVIQSFSLFNIKSVQDSGLLEGPEKLNTNRVSQRVLKNVTQLWEDPATEIKMLNAINLRLGISLLHTQRMENMKLKANTLLELVQKRLHSMT